MTRVVTNEEGTDDYVAHRLDYFTNGQAVEYVMGEVRTWGKKGDILLRHPSPRGRQGAEARLASRSPEK